MTNSKILISWIIIGRNWLDTIKELVDSLNSQKLNPEIVELIIIDDGSSDGAEQQLNNIRFENKQIIILDKQKGRSIARNTGIKIAKGKYCLFTSSNTIPNENFMEQYIKALSQSKTDGAAGPIEYQSKDIIFEKYLNSKNRGLNKYQVNDSLPIEYILFGNCMIKTDILKSVHGFKEQLTGYGGEEIELLSRVHNFKILKINAKTFRISHPGFSAHCKRLINFGETNFKLLSFSIQKNIIPGNLIRLSNILPISIIYYILLFIRNNLKSKSFILMKILMGLAILKGYKR